jgi:RimJ/RimL family protein N-acetyltransferase
MELRTPRLLLRPWRRGDEAALVAHANHREVWINLADIFPHPYREADAPTDRPGQADRGLPELAIVRDGGAGRGSASSDCSASTLGRLGYWLGPTAWGHGYATEAVRALAEYAFAETDLERLQARVYEWNPASCRVLEKAGFTQEARLRPPSSGRPTDRRLALLGRCVDLLAAVPPGRAITLGRPR